MAAVTDQAGGRKKKACVECRQQKMRCEGASDNGLTPCSRCRRLNTSCVFSSPFQRVHKRKRLQELENEASALKRELYSVAPSQPQPVEFDKSSQSRSIDGLEIGSPMIDNCFELFFRDYHHALPILEPLVAPDLLYGRSPLLFWIVVSIGSRRYGKHPTLMNALSSRVTNLILQSMNLRSKPLEAIKGFILILSWPFPSGSIYRDPSFIFGGALVHIAMQCGLHTPYLSMESSKLGPEFLETSSVKRAQIWAYVVITYQRLCTTSGQPALMSLDTYNEQPRFKDILQQLPATLQLQLQLVTILARAHKTFVELGLLTMTLQQERALDSVLKMLSSQIDSIESNATSKWDYFYIAAARQEINAMHFFKSSHTLDLHSCNSVYSTTVKVLEFIRNREISHALSGSCTRFVFTAALMGVSLMLRILKGSFATNVDQEHGSMLFLATAKFMQSCSVEKGDLPDRAALFAEQLWGSEKLFKDTDGTVNIALRVRNRLSASPLHDLIIRWREEFRDLGTQAAPSRKAELPNDAANFSSSFPSSIDPNALTANIFAEPTPLLTNELWGDLGLDLNDTWGFPGSNTDWTA